LSQYLIKILYKDNFLYSFQKGVDRVSLKYKFKIISIFILIFALTLTLSACDGIGEEIGSEPAEYDIDIIIEGVEDKAHYDLFTVTNDYDDTSLYWDSEDDLDNNSLKGTITGLEGEVEFTIAIDDEDIEGSYSTENNTEIVDESDSELKFNVEYNLPQTEVEFLVTNSNGESIKYAEIKINGEKYYTDQNGLVNINLPSGNYEYSAEMLGYEKQTKTLELEEDTEREIELTEKAYSGDGLVFEHDLILKEGNSYDLKMRTKITNINSNNLNLDIHGTDYFYGEGKKTFEIIDYDNMTVISATGSDLNKTYKTRKIDDPGENVVVPDYFVIDTLDIAANDSQTVIIEFEVANSKEKIEGFGGVAADPQNPDKTLDYWGGFYEWLVLRPSDLQSGDIKSNYLNINLPEGWNYASAYPEIEDNLIELGELEFMSWQNELTWKNIHMGQLVLFNEGPFLIEEGYAGGVKVQNVFHESLINYSTDANFDYIDFLSDYIGELPAEKVVTLNRPYGRQEEMDYFHSWQTGPDFYGYSITGNYFQTSFGSHSPGIDPVSWDFENYFLTPAHNTLRQWNGSMPGWASIYLEELAYDYRFPDWDFVEHRIKPMYEFYHENVVQNGEEEDVRRGGDGHSFIGYFKHETLIPYYFDQLIQEETDGKKDLSVVIQYIYSKMLEGEDVNNDLIIEALNQAVDHEIDFKNKYHDYYGDKILEIDDYIY